MIIVWKYEIYSVPVPGLQLIYFNTGFDNTPRIIISYGAAVEEAERQVHLCAIGRITKKNPR